MCLLNVSVPVVLSVSCSRRPFSKSILLLAACFCYVAAGKDKPDYSNLTSARLSPGSESVFRFLFTLASMAPHISQTNCCSLLKNGANLRHVQISCNDRAAGSLCGTALDTLRENPSMGEKLAKLRLTDEPEFDKKFTTAVKALSAARRKLLHVPSKSAARTSVTVE